MDCSPSGSSVHEISQTRILKWVAISFSRGSSQPRNRSCISSISRQILHHWAPGKPLQILSYHQLLFNLTLFFLGSCRFFFSSPLTFILRIKNHYRIEKRILGVNMLSCFSRVWLCDPIDHSPPGSPVPGILQARTLEWVAISFSNAWKWKVQVKSLSRVRPLATPWTAAYQTLPSMGFSRQEYWSGVPLPSPGSQHISDLYFAKGFNFPEMGNSPFFFFYSCLGLCVLKWGRNFFLPFSLPLVNENRWSH